MNEYKQKLIDKAHKLGVYDIASHVIADPRFEVWSGSGGSNHHHYGKGGLCQHTSEVVDICFSNIKILGLVDIDPIEIYLSALYHDSGKMWDYTPTDAKYTQCTQWIKSTHSRLIHHISRSAIFWNQVCTFHNFKYGKYADSVTHNILSHHGNREYGSPVAPKTKAAWLLHLSDSISARMNDADKIDLIKEKLYESN